MVLQFPCKGLQDFLDAPVLELEDAVAMRGRGARGRGAGGGGGGGGRGRAQKSAKDDDKSLGVISVLG